jgi:acyl dehydratase
VLIANLRYNEIMMHKPDFIGDVLRGETTVAELIRRRVA